ncbi:MAG TPA: hypothetical protein VEN29_09130 [Casimicrobiaceae bacterium]|nr:hypothetical protein [Casimicrobiaceae bacterium]
MALMDYYQKLCPKSGHVLSREEREALRAQESAGGKARTVRCDVCGQMVDVSPDPGTGRSLIYAMHLRACSEQAPKQEGSR